MWNKDARQEGFHDAEKAKETAATLYNAGENKWGTNEDTFVETLSGLSQLQAALVFHEYSKISGHTMEQAIAAEFSGHLLEAIMAVGNK